MEIFVSPYGVIITALICSTILIIILKGGHAKFGKLEVGKNQKDKPTKKRTLTILEAEELADRTKSHALKMEEIVRLAFIYQMRQYDETQNDIVGKLKNIFKDIVPEVETTNKMEYKSFNSRVVLIMELKVRPLIKEWFHINHYYNYEVEEQRDYIAGKIIVIQQILLETLEDDWCSSTITFKSVKDRYIKEVEEIESSIFRCFNQAFKISRDCQASLLEEKLKHQKFEEGMLTSSC